LALFILLILIFFFGIMGFMLKSTIGAIFLIVTGCMCINLIFFMLVYFAGIYAFSMTPIFVVIMVAFFHEGTRRLRK
jgi:cytochrome c oxidase subunit IV